MTGIADRLIARVESGLPIGDPQTLLLIDLEYLKLDEEFVNAHIARNRAADNALAEEIRGANVGATNGSRPPD